MVFVLRDAGIRAVWPVPLGHAEAASYNAVIAADSLTFPRHVGETESSSRGDTLVPFARGWALRSPSGCEAGTLASRVRRPVRRQPRVTRRRRGARAFPGEFP